MTKPRADEILKNKGTRQGQSRDETVSQDEESIVTDTSHIEDRDQEFSAAEFEGSQAERVDRAEIEGEEIEVPRPTPAGKIEPEDSFDDLGEEDLKERAKILGIPGYEEMDHFQLVLALKQALHAS